MRDGAIDDGNPEHGSVGSFFGFADRIHDLIGLAIAHADIAGTVSKLKLRPPFTTLATRLVSMIFSTKTSSSVFIFLCS